MSLERLVPAFRVKINGAHLPPRAAADLISVSVDENVEFPSMFSLRLINWDAPSQEGPWVDEDLFAEGNEVEIRMGYTDNLETLMTGEITGLEPEFCADEVPMLTVRGYDRRHRLLRGRKTRSFVQMTDSDIARKVAEALGLRAEVENTGVILDYVLQHNQTDMEFLKERAHRIGYEVVVEDKTLRFRPPKIHERPVLTLSRDVDLIEFHPRLTVMDQVGRITVRGWDLKEKSTIIGRSGIENIVSSMGGEIAGPAASDRALGEAAASLVDWPVFTRAEADYTAHRQFNSMALAHIRGEGICAGRPDLRAGSVIQIEGLGRRFSGRYYVTSSTHGFSPARGYRTEFTVRRNAS